ncbi:MAG: hypothetical protein CMJ46_04790 [Planctomyces sp.]|nr:hypothetical protein [Planctomyces sp.]
MHRDKKLGLALALMVIGIGTAFCFKQDLSKLSEGSFFEGAFTGGKTTSPDDSHNRVMEELAKASKEAKDPFDFSEPAKPRGRSEQEELENNRSNYTRNVSQSHRSPDWNDDFDVPAPSQQNTSRRDSMASNDNRGQSSRSYHVPDHNSDWDTPAPSRRENGNSSQYITTRDDAFDESRFNDNVSPFSNDTSFTSYPELLGESSGTRPNTNSSNSQARQNNYRNTSTASDQSRPRLNQSILTYDEAFDPFGDATNSGPVASSPQNRTQPRQNNGAAVTQREMSQPRPTTQQVSRPVSEQAIAPLSADTLLIHEVRRAETLSGISARYLGSANKFMQIYEANRDILKSPHDIRVGMKLRIPRPGAGNSQVSNAAPRELGARLDAERVTQSWSQEPVESLPEPYQEEEPTPEPYRSRNEMFVPVRRNPFTN